MVVATTGEGRLKGDEWQIAVKHGDTLVVPWDAGADKVEGNMELLSCLPPLPVDAAKDDPGAATDRDLGRQPRRLMPLLAGVRG